MNKPKILVADDIKQNVKLLRVILTASEFDVIEAYDGEEALEKAKSENPDLILLDIMMPKLTGYEVCQRLRADGTTKGIPIIMITALHEMEDRIKGIDAGADDFISKPFNKTELLARVKSLLRMRQPSVKKEETTILDTILSGLAEGVVVTDGQWKIKNINQTAKELLNIQETDTENPDILQYLSHTNLSLPRDTLVSTQEKTTDFQILPSNTQPAFPLSARMTKIFDESGNIINITLIVKSEEKK
ncbi:MAG TPA: response regulator transcription factor [Candidatus Wunengus sp. YC60]|uniref:response regulator transcription factor n=1 Tax=Candidatus Wunengus sp. YC60 TaxID=3367697 RepID=UPI004025B84C